ncbi:MAG TPA: BON domain-containing protein [Variovorax sp.]
MALAAGALSVAGLTACVPLVVGGAAAYGVGMVSTDRRSTGAQVDDQAIELRGAARIREIANDQMYVSVTSFNRQVLLTGTVGSDADKRRAGDVVSRVDNVRSVVNELTVGPALSFQELSNDAFISGKVKASLLDAKDIFANSFKVVTQGGVVYLMGIATRRETDRATDIARGVSGVTKVVRVVEIVTEADLAQQVQQQAPQSSGGSAVAPNAASGSRVPLPPMEPLPSSSTPAGGGVTTSPVR